MTNAQTISIMAAILLAKPGHDLRNRDQALECIEVADFIYAEVCEGEKPNPMDGVEVEELSEEQKAEIMKALEPVDGPPQLPKK